MMAVLNLHIELFESKKNDSDEHERPLQNIGSKEYEY